MAGQVPEKTKKKRRDRAMAEQLKVSREIGASFVGREIRVLLEKEAAVRELDQSNVSSWEHALIRNEGADEALLKGRFLVARGEADAPDIDGRVYVQGTRGLGMKAGSFARVKIIGHTDYDLIATPA
jgi:ribosomal protein S12 methylthiotransferase